MEVFSHTLLTQLNFSFYSLFKTTLPGPHSFSTTSFPLLFTAMVRYLIFSFAFIFELALDQASLTSSYVIHLGLGFHLFKVLTNTSILFIVLAKVVFI